LEVEAQSADMTPHHDRREISIEPTEFAAAGIDALPSQIVHNFYLLFGPDAFTS